MKAKLKIQDILLLIVGCFLMAVSINLFLDPYNIAPGGLTGLAIIINNLLHIPVWLTNIVLNIPLFILAFKFLGKETVKTILGIVFLTVFLKLTEVLKAVHVTSDLFLSTVFGGIVLGISLGLIFRVNGSTGGTDLIGVILHEFFPNLSVAKLMGIADACIVVLSGVASKNVEIALYSAIALFIAVKVSDIIVEGVQTSATFIIISDKYEEIGRVVQNELDRGATLFNGTGLYTGNHKNILLTVVSKKEVVAFKKFIKQIDPNCFMIITDNHETIGEGFKELN